MPQRTIQEASAQFEEMAQVLSPQILEPLAGELEVARAAATEMAFRYRDQRAAESERLSGDVRTGLLAVRGAFAELIADGQSGQVTASEFNERLSRLRQRQRDLERRVGEISRAADQLDEIEADPARWADETFYARFPLIRPEFSF